MWEGASGKDEKRRRETEKTNERIGDIIDLLLDQEGFECDPINPRDGDTPLHSAVRWINSLSQDKWESASGLIEMMLEAGNEPKYDSPLPIFPIPHFKWIGI